MVIVISKCIVYVHDKQKIVVRFQDHVIVHRGSHFFKNMFGQSDHRRFPGVVCPYVSQLFPTPSYGHFSHTQSYAFVSQ